MQSVSLVIVFEIRLKPLILKYIVYLNQIKPIFVANQLNKRYLIERVDVIDSTSKISEQSDEAKLSSESGIKERG